MRRLRRRINESLKIVSETQQTISPSTATDCSVETFIIILGRRIEEKETTIKVWGKKTSWNHRYREEKKKKQGIAYQVMSNDLSKNRDGRKFGTFARRRGEAVENEADSATT